MSASPSVTLPLLSLETADDAVQFFAALHDAGLLWHCDDDAHTIGNNLPVQMAGARDARWTPTFAQGRGCAARLKDADADNSAPSPETCEACAFQELMNRSYELLADPCATALDVMDAPGQPAAGRSFVPAL